MPKRASTPVRIDAALYDEATTVASLLSRSVAQQIAHWARIGRELEASPGVSVSDVVEVLKRGDGYDGLDRQEQAVVRAFWEERIETLRGGLRLDQEFSRAGRAWVELDDEGNVVRRRPAASAEPG